ncbi:hypothetical protein GOBAR_AA12857 [Gossypium barbadense]|uniref:Uncharacterized protein n=1 Tax=Gossypium barbadense TaxID=3634 RepID=A0A2P5XWS7_GOSBA|nr:hypothetical protein GOBAR_AA12857 [Gossypium barbadense]
MVGRSFAIFIFVSFRVIFVRVRVERGEGIRAFDGLTDGKKGNPSKNSSAPGVRVPTTVLPDGVPPLISKGRRVRVSKVWWVGETDPLMAQEIRGSVAFDFWD